MAHQAEEHKDRLTGLLHQLSLDLYQLPVPCRNTRLFCLENIRLSEFESLNHLSEILHSLVHMQKRGQVSIEHV